MKTTSSTLLFTLIATAALPLVNAHGLLTALTIDGKKFDGNVADGPAKPSGIRRITNPEPIKGATNPNINCGTGAKPADLILDAMPGSKLAVTWKGEDLSNWPHNVGPVLTYMASCGDQTCDKFDPTKAKWFKIQQDGKKADGTWAQQDLMKGQDLPVAIPSNLAPGNYMLRNEIIALHLGNTMGGAEFYAACAQLKVGGSATGVPSASDLVSLPGAYKDNDPGIFVPNVFDKAASYTFPGPKVANLGTGSGSGSASGSIKHGKQCRLKAPKTDAKPAGNAAAAPAPAPAPTPAGPAAPGPSAPAPSAPANNNNSYMPRQLSRVMRNLRPL